MPTTFTDQFFTVDPGNRPPFGTQLTFQRFDYTDQDDDARPVRWVLDDMFRAVGRFAPVQFAKDAIGNDASLLGSPQHRVLISGRRAQIVYGQGVPSESCYPGHVGDRTYDPAIAELNALFPALAADADETLPFVRPVLGRTEAVVLQ